jgi:hypothetical protein
LHPAPPGIIIGVYHKGKKKDEKMLDAIKKLFRRKHTTPSPVGNGVEERSPLRIEGVKPALLTPEPDDAELAAQALLESLCDVRSKMEDVRGEYYNLAGQRVAQPTKGIYISNGKKVTVK